MAWIRREETQEDLENTAVEYSEAWDNKFITYHDKEDL